MFSNVTVNKQLHGGKKDFICYIKSIHIATNCQRDRENNNKWELKENKDELAKLQKDTQTCSMKKKVILTASNKQSLLLRYFCVTNAAKITRKYGKI